MLALGSTISESDLRLRITHPFCLLSLAQCVHGVYLIYVGHQRLRNITSLLGPDSLWWRAKAIRGPWKENLLIQYEDRYLPDW